MAMRNVALRINLKYVFTSLPADIIDLY